MVPDQPPEQLSLYAGLGLTDQDLLVCRLVCAVDEPTVAAVADFLGLPLGTVHRHMEKLHLKLGVHTRAGLMRRAIELGIVTYCCAQCAQRQLPPTREQPVASAL